MICEIANMSDDNVEKQPAVVESTPREYTTDAEKKVAVGSIYEKSDLHLDDETGELAVQALRSDEADPVVAKRVLRKIDLYILPFMCITYGKDELENSRLFRCS